MLLTILRSSYRASQHFRRRSLATKVRCLGARLARCYSDLGNAFKIQRHVAGGGGFFFAVSRFVTRLCHLSERYFQSLACVAVAVERTD